MDKDDMKFVLYIYFESSEIIQIRSFMKREKMKTVINDSYQYYPK